MSFESADPKEGAMHHDTYDNTGERRRVPVWVPSENDPEGLDGRWQFIDPQSPDVEPTLAARALAVAELWDTDRLPHVA